MQRQSGFSFFWALVIVVLLSAAGLFGIRVGGLYFDHWVVQEVFADWQQDPEVADYTARELRREFDTRMRVNSLTGVMTRDDLSIERNGQQWIITADYERRVNLYDNIDLVVSFSDTATLGQP